ncbi:MAG: RcpC/CpaB family pilus assembly protein [Actinomycetota bacterium]|nr:RcpC/CpaB family pilus assembly protein [Actinomycetota bacterium]
MLFSVAFFGAQRLIAGARATVPVLVAARDLPTDHTLTAADLVRAEVALPPELMTRYALASRDLAGVSLSRPVAEGEMIALSWVAEGRYVGEGRALTIPITAEHAVGGDLQTGDRVDILATFDSGEVRARTVLVAGGVEIVNPVEAGGLVTGEASVIGVTVAVTPEQAAELTFAIRSADLDVVRVEGAAAPGADAVTHRSFR